MEYDIINGNYLNWIRINSAVFIRQTRTEILRFNVSLSDCYHCNRQMKASSNLSMLSTMAIRRGNSCHPHSGLYRMPTHTTCIYIYKGTMCRGVNGRHHRASNHLRMLHIYTTIIPTYILYV